MDGGTGPEGSVAGATGQLDSDLDPFAFTDQRDRDAVASFFVTDRSNHSGRTICGGTVDSDDEVANEHTSTFGWCRRFDSTDDDALATIASIFEADTEVGFVPFGTIGLCPQRFDDRQHLGDRDRETDVGRRRCGGVTGNGGINANDLARSIDKLTARITGLDRSIRLDQPVEENVVLRDRSIKS